MSTKTYTGSCHCGRVRYEARLDLSEPSNRCNCSFCGKLRSWTVNLKPDAFRLLSGEQDVTSYQFGLKNGDHLFCKHCGVHAFGRGHVPELGGDFYTVSVACLDDVEPSQLAKLPIRYMNGRDDDWFSQPAMTSYM
jgi:hypothetical protein